jgi:Tol biopolymer transport system component
MVPLLRAAPAPILAVLALAATGAQVASRASVSSAGLQGTARSQVAAISADGRFIAFQSWAPDLVPGDTNGAQDIFVHDRASGATERVSVATGGAQADGASGRPSLSGDGRFVAFQSFAANLVAGDTNGECDVFVRDRWAGTTERASVASNGAEVGGPSFAPSLSADARFVAFHSSASDLVAADANGVSDVFVRDRLLGKTVLASAGSLGSPGNGGSSDASLSPDGGFVAFHSRASDLVPGDTNQAHDVFLRDLAAGTTVRASLAPGHLQLDGDSLYPSLGDGGRAVAFSSRAASLEKGPVDGRWQIYVRLPASDRTWLASASSSGAPGQGGSHRPSLAADGRSVAFQSEAPNLVPGDSNGKFDVFLRHLPAGPTQRVSLGPAGIQGNGDSGLPALSGDGGVVAFESWSATFAAGDTNADWDIFVAETALACPLLAVYCTPTASGAGCVQEMGASGLPRSSGPDAFFVTALHSIAGEPGLLGWGLAPAALPFAGGTLCVQPPLTRVSASASNAGAGACGGTLSFHFAQGYMAAHALPPGATVYAQYATRDPSGGPGAAALSAGLAFTIVP